MNKNDNKQLSDKAANQTLALNPLVGVSPEDLLSAARITARQAIKQPISVARAGLSFAQKLASIALGELHYDTAPKDRRFTDATWSKSPIHRNLLQSYLALTETLKEWVIDAGFDELDARRARFIVDIVTDSVAPTNTLLGNPAALKQLIETGGGSLVSGARNFLHDRQHNNGMPSQVDKSKFELGVNLALTQGSVVFRNDIIELIQYRPITENVHHRPLLFIPPQINKFYLFDLSPEKSYIGHCVKEGFQTFTVSWRNPGPEHAEWSIDHYVNALKEAVDVVKNITRCKSVNLLAACSGGVTGTVLGAHLSALNDKSINSLTLPVCVLHPQGGETDLGLFMNDAAVEAARRRSRAQGVLRGQDLAKIFSWMKPNDLIWSYVVNNYLLGNSPPIFDILYWNGDATNLPAQLHSDFLDIVGTGALTKPDDVSVCDTDIDLGSVDFDSFIVGGTTDHLTPWKACYRSTHVLGGKNEFVLVAGGHIQSILQVADNPKAKYFTNRQTPDTADAWLDGAEEQAGSWWPYWTAWLRSRSGKTKRAPSKIGNAKYVALCDAPGTYVRQSAA